MNRWFTLLLGIILILVAVYAYIAFNWWQYLILFFKGVVPLIVAAVGLIFILVGLTED